MLSSLSIAIHLIRHEANEDRDDLITIQKDLSTNEFNVTLKEASGTVKYTLTGLYRARALDYVYILLKNLALDEEGYRDVQVDLPALPQVIVSAKKMKDLYYRQHFIEAIGDGLDNLENGEVVQDHVPKVGSKRRASPCCPCPPPPYESAPRRNTHLFFD
jgi:hypothetical protein